MGHAVAVAHDFHRRPEAGQSESTVELRQRLAQPGIARTGGEGDEEGKRHKYASYYFHRVNISSPWPLTGIGWHKRGLFWLGFAKSGSG